MIKDPHDRRPFRQYVKLAPDGSIVSVHEVAAGIEHPFPKGTAVEVTDVPAADVDAVVARVGLAMAAKLVKG